MTARVRTVSEFHTRYVPIGGPRMTSTPEFSPAELGTLQRFEESPYAPEAAPGERSPLMSWDDYRRAAADEIARAAEDAS